VEAVLRASSTYTGGRERMGKKIETSETIPFTLEQFYKFIEEKKLMAVKCRQCGTMFVPPRPMCTSCFSKDLSWVKLENKGKLVTYTIIYVAPEQFQSIVPYAYGIIEIENSLRLPGIIRGLEHEKIEVGTELEVDFETDVCSNWPRWPRYFFKPP
jgi:uncharacterized OB-fold protein